MRQAITKEKASNALLFKSMRCLRPLGVSDSDPRVPAPQGLNDPLGKLPPSRNKQDDKFIAHNDGFELLKIMDAENNPLTNAKQQGHTNPSRLRTDWVDLTPVPRDPILFGLVRACARPGSARFGFSVLIFSSNVSCRGGRGCNFCDFRAVWRMVFAVFVGQKH